MLNDLLYKALVDRFHKVLVSNKGQHAAIKACKNRACGWDIARGDAHGEQYIVSCPFCKDPKHHLYISYLSYAQPCIDGVLYAKGNLRAKCFRRDCLAKKENREELDKKLFLNFGNIICREGREAENIINCDLDNEEPEPVRTLSASVTLDGLKTWIPDWNVFDEYTDPIVREYLEDRRVTDDDIAWLKIGWGPIRSPRSKRYLNNGLPFVLFPIINNNQLVGVQARCPDQYMSPDQPKYYFHPGCRKQTLLFNLDVARKLGVAIVSEGVFDVLSVGHPGVCCFGHTPSIAQMRLLSTFEHGIVFLPDTDVRSDLNTIEIAKRCANELSTNKTFDKGVYVVQLSHKDAGEMTRKQVWDEILAQVPPIMKDYLSFNILNKR